PMAAPTAPPHEVHADFQKFMFMPFPVALQEAAAAASSSSQGPSDFFATLPQRPSSPERTALNQAQKLHWLQLASTGDPLALDGAMDCLLCSEPLVMDATVTTPCKHQFHQHCVRRLESPECPLCSATLPFSWFLPSDHPCAEHGFKVVTACSYKPRFAGGPSRGNCGWPLHRPPPASLHGPGGITMKSYLHRGVPLGPEEELEEEEDVDGSRSPQAPCARSPATQATDEGDDASSRSSSSDESSSEDGAERGGSEVGCRDAVACAGRPRPWLFTACGRMRPCELGDEAEVEEPAAAAASAGAELPRDPEEQRNPVVLLIGSHV
ncbi:unnamed protein product, partial [Prorocentrum cordatum]